MAFSYAWHADVFSYKEKNESVVQSTVVQKKKKKKNMLNGHTDTQDSTDAIESASKKLKLCCEDSSPSESEPKKTVESLLAGAISASQVKSAIKTAKSKQFSVSFADDVQSTIKKNEPSASNANSVTRNSVSTEGSKKKQKKRKKMAESIDTRIASSKNPINTQVNGAILNGTHSTASGSATPASEHVTDVGTNLKKRKEKLASKVTGAMSLELKEADSVYPTGPAIKKRKTDLPANSEPGSCSNKMSNKASERGSVNKKEKMISETKKKTLKSSDDEDDWKDLDSDIDWDSIDADEKEVLDYSNEEEPELDEKFHSDLKSLLAELNFDAVKKNMHLKEENMNDDLEEEIDFSADEEEKNNDIEDNISDEGSHASSEQECSKESKSVNHEMKSTNFELEENAPSKEVIGPQSTVVHKIGASLAKFGMPGGEHLKKQFRSSLAEKMNQKLNVAQFRMINEQLYKTTGTEAQALFRDDPESFRVYHEGFKSQVALWPLKPLDIIVDWLKIQDSGWTVADFGCGEGELASRVKQKVHSLDLVALKPHITVCDMAHTPLKSQSINVAVFCLSLMGTNVSDFIKEANRTLKSGGIMKIAEVESRITNVEEFVANVQKLGFKCWKKPVNHNYFVSFDFKKVKDVKNRANLPEIKLKPCLYKKR